MRYGNNTAYSLDYGDFNTTTFSRLRGIEMKIGDLVSVGRCAYVARSKWRFNIEYFQVIRINPDNTETVLREALSEAAALARLDDEIRKATK